MEIRTDRDGGVLVARIDGRVDSVNAREFQDAFHAVIDECDPAVVLDLGRLTHISSAGLRVIPLVATALREAEREADRLFALGRRARGVQDQRVR